MASQGDFFCLPLLLFRSPTHLLTCRLLGAIHHLHQYGYKTSAPRPRPLFGMVMRCESSPYQTVDVSAEWLQKSIRSTYGGEPARHRLAHRTSPDDGGGGMGPARTPFWWILKNRFLPRFCVADIRVHGVFDAHGKIRGQKLRKVAETTFPL